MNEYGEKVAKKMSNYMGDTNSVDQEINDIQNAIEGVEVRGALAAGVKKSFDKSEESESKAIEAHDVMENIMNEGFDNAALEANFEQKLDDKIANLQPEWTQFKENTETQLADKASSDDLNSGLSKKRDKNTAINMSDLSQGVKEAMTGGSVAVVGEKTVRSINIVDGGIDVRSVSFAKAGKNKFDEQYISGAYLSGGVSNMSFAESSNDDYIVSIIPIEENKTYTVSKSASNRFRLAINKGYPSTGTTVTKGLAEAPNDNETSFTFNSEDCDYLIVYVATDGNVPDWMQVETGTNATPYVRQKVVIDYEDKSFSPNYLKNINTNAILVGDRDCFVIDVGQESVRTKKQGSFVTVGSKWFELNDGEYVFSGASTQTVIIAIDVDTSDLNFFGLDTYVNSDKNKYVMIGEVRRSDKSVSINGNHLVTNDDSNQRFIITGDLTSEYIPNSSFMNHDSSVTVEDVYAIYDDLVDRFPNYVSKRLSDTEPSGLPIYDYFFIPPKAISYPEQHFPRVYYQTGLHGHEKQSVVAGALFFKELCERWQEDSVLKTLRWSVRFTVRPIANPYGFSVNERKNFNDVDLNRNFDFRWAHEEDPESWYYQGPEPLSEIETQSIVNYIMSQRRDIDLAIDHHNGGLGWYWAEAHEANLKRTIGAIGQQMTAYVSSEFVYVDSEENHAQIAGTLAGGRGQTTSKWKSLGVPAILLETRPSGQGSTPEDIQKYTMYAIGNTIAGLLRNYDKFNQR